MTSSGPATDQQAALHRQSSCHSPIRNSELRVHPLEARIDRTFADLKFSGDLFAAVSLVLMTQKAEFCRCKPGLQDGLSSDAGSPPVVQFRGDEAGAESETTECVVLEESRGRDTEAQQAGARVCDAGMHWNERRRRESALVGPFDNLLLRRIDDRKTAGDDGLGMIGGIFQPGIALQIFSIDVVLTPPRLARKHEATTGYVRCVPDEIGEHRAINAQLFHSKPEQRQDLDLARCPPDPFGDVVDARIVVTIGHEFGQRLPSHSQ